MMTDRSRKRKKGVTLLLTLIIITTLAVVVTAFLYMVSVQTKGSGYTIDSAKEFWLAEAGIQQVIYKLKTDEAYRTTLSPNPLTGTLGTGSYSVVVTGPVSNTYTLTSTGTFGVINRTIQQTVVVKLAGTFDALATVDNNILTSQATNLVLTGELRDHAPNLQPNVNFTYYYNNTPVAQRKVGDYTFPAGTYSGLWYVSGTATISSNVTINGTLVAGNQISCVNKSNVTINPTGLTHTALIAGQTIDFGRTSNLTITKGIIFAGVTVNKDLNLNRTNGANINAVIFTNQNCDFSRSNNVTVTWDSGVKANPPPSDAMSGGGGGTATVSPQKDWQEQ